MLRRLVFDRRARYLSQPNAGWVSERFILFLSVLMRSVLYQLMEPTEFMADPQQLEVDAHQEPRRRGLDDYREAIRVLKEEKDFSLREIAAWLQQRGLKVDHNAVWRIYSKRTAGSPSARSVKGAGRTEGGSAKEGAMPWMDEA